LLLSPLSGFVDRLRSMATRPNNLPLQFGSFVRREREIAEIKRLLAESRLVTFTGAGGCGKTRLALQVAAGLLDTFPDGAWFVDLAPIAGAGLVVPKIAQALSVPLESGIHPPGTYRRTTTAAAVKIRDPTDCANRADKARSQHKVGSRSKLKVQTSH
jgi:hypothetical protein